MARHKRPWESYSKMEKRRRYARGRGGPSRREGYPSPIYAGGFTKYLRSWRPRKDRRLRRLSKKHTYRHNLR